MPWFTQEYAGALAYMNLGAPVTVATPGDLNQALANGDVDVIPMRMREAFAAGYELRRERPEPGWQPSGAAFRTSRRSMPAPTGRSTSHTSSMETHREGWRWRAGRRRSHTRPRRMACRSFRGNGCIARSSSRRRSSAAASLRAPIVVANAGDGPAAFRDQRRTRAGGAHAAVRGERGAGERIVIGDDIVLHVQEVTGSTVRLGIEAPKALPVYREEIWAAVKEENARAAAADVELPRGPIVPPVG